MFRLARASSSQQNLSDSSPSLQNQSDWSLSLQNQSDWSLSLQSQPDQLLCLLDSSPSLRNLSAQPLSQHGSSLCKNPSVLPLSRHGSSLSKNKSVPPLSQHGSSLSQNLSVPQPSRPVPTWDAHQLSRQPGPWQRSRGKPNHRPSRLQGPPCRRPQPRWKPSVRRQWSRYGRRYWGPPTRSKQQTSSRTLTLSLAGLSSSTIRWDNWLVQNSCDVLKSANVHRKPAVKKLRKNFWIRCCSCMYYWSQIANLICPIVKN